MASLLHLVLLVAAVEDDVTAGVVAVRHPPRRAAAVQVQEVASAELDRGGGSLDDDFLLRCVGFDCFVQFVQFSNNGGRKIGPRVSRARIVGLSSRVDVSKGKKKNDVAMDDAMIEQCTHRRRRWSRQHRQREALPLPPHLAPSLSQVFREKGERGRVSIFVSLSLSTVPLISIFSFSFCRVEYTVQYSSLLHVQRRALPEQDEAIAGRVLKGAKVAMPRFWRRPHGFPAGRVGRSLRASEVDCLLPLAVRKAGRKVLL